MKITNKYLLEYIAKRPELSGFYILDRGADFCRPFDRFSFGHTSFAGQHLCIASGADEEAIARNLRSFMDQPHYEDEALMLYGA